MEMVENLYKHSKVYGNNMKMVGNLLKLYGNYMETIWKLYGKDVERMWKQYGNEMEMEFSFCYLQVVMHKHITRRQQTITHIPLYKWREAYLPPQESKKILNFYCPVLLSRDC